MSPIQPDVGRMQQLDRARADRDATAGDRQRIDADYLSLDARLAGRDYAKLRAGSELLSKADAAREAARTPRDGHLPVRLDTYA